MSTNVRSPSVRAASSTDGELAGGKTRPSLLELRDVSVGYGGVAVLQSVSLTIARGEFCVLLGPNGAGKTTLLRAILGLVPVLAGRIDYRFDRAASPPGYVPQRDALDPAFPLTALEVVQMGTYAKAPPLLPLGRRRRLLAAQCLAQVGLADRARTPFRALSGGQKQRILIARALAAEPEVLLMDEPTAGVDPAAAAAIVELISNLHRQQQLTVILVSHHAEFLQSVVDSVVWVEGGSVARKEPTADARTIAAPPQRESL